MSILTESADGKKHEFPDGTPPEVVDKVMREYARSSADPLTQKSQDAVQAAGVSEAGLKPQGITNLSNEINAKDDARTASLDPQERYLRHADSVGKQRFAEGTDMTIPEMVMGGGPIIGGVIKQGVKATAKAVGKGIVGSMVGSKAGEEGVKAMGGGPTAQKVGKWTGAAAGGWLGAKLKVPEEISLPGGFKLPMPKFLQSPYVETRPGPNETMDRIKPWGKMPQGERVAQTKPWGASSAETGPNPFPDKPIGTPIGGSTEAPSMQRAIESTRNIQGISTAPRTPTAVPGKPIQPRNPIGGVAAGPSATETMGRQIAPEAPGVIRAPVPTGTDAKLMGSIPRAELEGMAARGVPGAAEQLRKLGHPTIYTPGPTIGRK